MPYKNIKNKVIGENYIKREELKEFQGGLKKEDKKRNKELQKRIKNKGFSAPIYIWHDHDNYILDGHQRLIALNKLSEKGYILEEDKVPVVYIIADTIQEAKESVMEYNARYAEFDMDVLSDWVMGLDMDGIDLGFDLPNLNDGDDFNEDIEDEVPEIPVEPVVKYGDIFILGDHVIMCGDTTNQDDINILMQSYYITKNNKSKERNQNNIKADLIRTDPPYNVNYHGQGENTSNGIKNDNMSSNSFYHFLLDSFKNMVEVKNPTAGVYLRHNHKEQINFEKAILDSNLIIKQQLVRNKPSAGLGMGDYRPKHELCFYCSNRNETNRFYGDRTNASVLDLKYDDHRLLKMIKQWREAETKGRTTILSIRRDNVNEYIHPTQKPVELCEIAVVNNTKKGDIVLDGFLGSGVTVITCEKKQRRCYGMELDPRYVQVIIQRYYNVTNGKKPIKCINRELDIKSFLNPIQNI